MPLARIEVEQVEGARWVAEVEAGGLPGGPSFKRERFAATTFDDIMAQVTAAYAVSQAVKPPKVAVEWAEPPAEDAPSRDELFAKAEALGINPDKRWGEMRLAREIAEAEGASRYLKGPA